jgi:hypothetical protein
VACHNGLVTASGLDISIGGDWQASMMANSFRDPYWQAAVRREILVRPAVAAAIQNECAACHMPMVRFEAKSQGAMAEVFAHLPVTHQTSRDGRLAADGVSCSMCHQIGAEGLGSHASFTAGFVVDSATPMGQRRAFGPFKVDEGRQQLMRSASLLVPEEALHVQQSELCATCHTLYTHALDKNGKVVGELPEQVPYLEWRHSSYVRSRSCQSCHMPEVDEPAAVSSVLGIPRDNVSRHVFRGGNFLLPKMLSVHRAELGVKASSQQLATAARRTSEHLASAAATVEIGRAALASGALEVEVVVGNLVGHKLPTAYPSRRAWLHLKVLDNAGTVLFESGALAADGSITGNDNDAEAARFEAHHGVISEPDQVQIWEAILGGPDGSVTTELLTATSYLKDNRILPQGFDKTTAEDDIAVFGAAADDVDFCAGGDRVRYQIAVGDGAGPLTVEAALMYQPISYRWAHNLGQQRSAEIDRFVTAYRELAGGSAEVLARARTVAE